MGRWKNTFKFSRLHKHNQMIIFLYKYSYQYQLKSARKEKNN